MCGRNASKFAESNFCKPHAYNCAKQRNEIRKLLIEDVVCYSHFLLNSKTETKVSSTFSKRFVKNTTT